MERSVPFGYSESQDPGEASFSVSAPSLSLPKGGGAVRGIGEKFAASPVTGTGSMSVPIATSPGRSGFGPQLSLSYDSGAGNGPFGFGWSLSVPMISRKTDKGLPQYRDAEESDVFLLSGAEDLVPVLMPDGKRHEDSVSVPGFTIHRYRPRIEGLFSRIERWTNVATGELHWRSISRDNVTTVYGKDNNSRIFDPADPDPQHPTCIFSWHICESYDDKGNAIIYEYAEENADNVDRGQANERNRIRTANRYLKRIKYGNRISRLIQPDLSAASWMFEVVFDYDDGHYQEVVSDPSPDQHRFTRASASAGGNWAVRPDPFSSHRAGFEVRTYRRCHRVLMFHHIPDLPTGEKGYEGLVRTTEFEYTDLDYEQPVTIAEELTHQGSTRFASFIRAITQSGYVRDDTQPVVVKNGVEYAMYLKKSLPPLEFEYSKAAIQDQVQEVDAASLENLPVGLDGSAYQWVDLHGEGITGILTEQSGAWFYKPNISPISERPVEFAPLQRVASKPNLNTAGGQAQFMDLAGDGQPDLVVMDGPMPGLYEHDDEESWQPFRPFTSRLNLDTRDPNLKFIDLDGDGHADVLITEQDVFTWHPSLAEEGFGPARRVAQVLDEEKGPRVVFADGTQSIYLADMCGDGLTDLIRIRNGEVCYWPNMGYGRFGAKVTMDNSPWFDNPDQFDQMRIRLADIDGSGATDIIYLHRDGVRLYFNQSGNGWSSPQPLAVFPRVDNLVSIMLADLMGNGTACLVWSSPLASDGQRPMRYINLMGNQKPHLLVKTVNNLGTETRVQYASSTKFYLQDKRDGNPWVTRLPFPVHCVEKISVTDTWRQTTFCSQYTYHHGYFDGPEREFRGFGRLEQVDVETYGEFARGNEASPYITDDKTLYQPPVKTITWFHTGAFLDRERILNQFQEEYFPNWLDQAGLSIDADTIFSERALPEPDLPHLDLTATEWREALRACKGMALRQEVYELDVDALEAGRQVPTKLFTAAAHNCQIRRIQPRADNQHAVFLVTESESLTYHYELDLTELTVQPDPRITHTLVLNTNEYGQPLQQAAVAYPRVRPFEQEESLLTPNTIDLIREVQAELHIGYTEAQYTNDVDADGHYRLRLPYEATTFEVTGIRPQNEDDQATADPWDDVYFTLDELRAFRLSDTYQTEGIAVETVPYHLLPNGDEPQKRLVEQVRTLYLNGDLNGHLEPGELNHLGLTYETYKLALTDDLLDAILREKLEGLIEAGETYTDAVQRILLSGGYYLWDSQWWARSGIAGFATDAADHFYLPERYIDPFDQITELTFDDYDLYIRHSVDPVGNTTLVDSFDFRVLAPARIRDPNDNLSAVAFDTLGLPIATAVMGKEGTESGDTLAGLREDLTIGERAAFFTGDEYDDDQARDWLGQATARFIYYFGEVIGEDGSVTYGQHPPCACGILREKHVNQLAGSEQSPLQAAFEYSDGMGQVLVTKSMAEPDPDIDDGPLRWLASGKTILNNKGKPVKQYEPYFSESGHHFEEPQEVGVTPIMYYDAVGRLIRTELPDGSFGRVNFSPWQVTSYDANDTVMESRWYTDRNPPDPALPLPTNPLTGQPSATPHQRAAWLTALHSDTPAQTILDSLGREVIAIAHNRVEDPTGTVIHGGKTYADEKYVTFTRLDAEGKPLWIRDARNNRVMQYVTPPIPAETAEDPDSGYVPCYDIAGNLLFQHSMDAGDRWTLNDVTGKPLYSWDSRNNTLRTTYDPLRRPVSSELRNDDHADWIVVGCTRYGDEPGLSDAQMRNLRGQPYRSYDQSGLVTNVGFDFKGNPLEVQRRIALAYETEEDWRPALDISLEQELGSLLMDETFRQITEYDALNRVTRQYQWHQGPGSRVVIVDPYYNQRGLLQQEDVVLDAIKTDEGYEGGARSSMVQRVTYNAKGQRKSIHYGNSTTTTYDYDPDTFRIIFLQTKRDSDGKRLQELRYTYDPGGNITEIIDKAQPTIFFNNSQIDAHNRYGYDALYHLIEARGREHAGQVAHNTYDNWHDCAFKGRYHPNDAMAWREYTERYEYDSVGNILRVRHTANEDTANSWTRQYQYAHTSNRLLATGIGSTQVEHYVDTPSLKYRYAYNVHGSMTSTPHLQTMNWDFTEHLHHISRTTGSQGEGNDGCPDTSLEAWYRYDASKQRVRKRVRKQGGLVEERLYLGSIEIFRKFNAQGTLTLERETLHIMDDKQHIALVETRTLDTTGDDPALRQVIRYQYGNHLGSASLELDEQAQIISYEEYSPYGSTSYQAVRSQTETPKRYRYTGMERDEETGLNYHGARYYALWLGRWCSCDPEGLVDGVNIYDYGKNNSIVSRDLSGRQSTCNAPICDFQPPQGVVYSRNIDGETVVFPAVTQKDKEKNTSATVIPVRITVPSPPKGDLKTLDRIRHIAESTLPKPSPTYYRVTGMFQGAISAVGIGVGAYATVVDPEPSSKMVAAALTLRSLDLLSADVQQVWTGQQTPTLLHDAAMYSAQELGADPELGSAIATSTEVFVDLGLGQLQLKPPAVNLPDPPPGLNQMARDIRGPIVDMLSDYPKAGRVRAEKVMVAVGESNSGVVVTVSDPLAWDLLYFDVVPLPPGARLGPPPHQIKVGAVMRLDPRVHVEIANIWEHERLGAQGGLVGTSGYACEICTPRFRSSEFPTWTHVNLPPQ